MTEEHSEQRATVCSLETRIETKWIFGKLRQSGVQRLRKVLLILLRFSSVLHRDWCSPEKTLQSLAYWFGIMLPSHAVLGAILLSSQDSLGAIQFPPQVGLGAIQFPSQTVLGAILLSSQGHPFGPYCGVVLVKVDEVLQDSQVAPDGLNQNNKALEDRDNTSTTNSVQSVWPFKDTSFRDKGDFWR
ncbi:hypothetical protein ElyMa_001236900 [Elysia marginata]|uniref:Uncharacterized protein n=1 Tax=Elysia marginata TaxID=1093978 RepID=A0AAV4IBF1_9GAST|nr:hypothetical protein ElyMa_001236900 [Elysia marginata]